MKILVGGAWPCCSVFSSCKVRGWLGLDSTAKIVPSGFSIPTPEPLFECLDTQTIGRSLLVKKAP